MGCFYSSNRKIYEIFPNQIALHGLKNRRAPVNYNLDDNIEAQCAVKALELFETDVKAKPAKLNLSKSVMFAEDTFSVECYDDIPPDLAIKLVEFVRSKEK
jgi:hypothetical protein